MNSCLTTSIHVRLARVAVFLISPPWPSQDCTFFFCFWRQGMVTRGSHTRHIKRLPFRSHPCRRDKCADVGFPRQSDLHPLTSLSLSVPRFALAFILLFQSSNFMLSNCFGISELTCTFFTNFFTVTQLDVLPPAGILCGRRPQGGHRNLTIKSQLPRVKVPLVLRRAVDTPRAAARHPSSVLRCRGPVEDLHCARVFPRHHSRT